MKNKQSPLKGQNNTSEEKTKYESKYASECFGTHQPKQQQIVE